MYKIIFGLVDKKYICCVIQIYCRNLILVYNEFKEIGKLCCDILLKCGDNGVIFNVNI